MSPHLTLIQKKHTLSAKYKTVVFSKRVTYPKKETLVSRTMGPLREFLWDRVHADTDKESTIAIHDKADDEESCAENEPLCRIALAGHAWPLRPSIPCCDVAVAATAAAGNGQAWTRVTTLLVSRQSKFQAEVPE